MGGKSKKVEESNLITDFIYLNNTMLSKFSFVILILFYGVKYEICIFLWGRSSRW